ncbi:Thiamine pyrophosphokinase [Sergentomyia squamirostris]
MENHVNNSSLSQEITTNWSPEKYLTVSGLKEEDYALVVLNRPINCEENFVIELWNSAQIRLTVDGGTDRWLNFSSKSSSSRKILPPDMVTGDFDSIHPETLTTMKSLNCDIIRTPDQNETDFTKAIRELKPRLNARNVETVIVLAETSGRLDQIMANINTLFKAQTFSPELDIFILSSDSLSWLLSPGHHSITIPRRILDQKLWCSVIPIGRKCVVTSRGLKWNMTGQTIQFGGIVSTSNTYSGLDRVEITTSDHVLWCMGTKVD